MEPGEDGGRVKAANEAVLIVEDDAPVRNLLKTILEAEGYPWDAAGDAAEARNRLAEKEYALVLTDINMPGESGLDLARFVNSEYPDTALVFISVIDDPAVISEILEIGVQGYIVKPFEKIHVLVNVAGALARRRMESDKTWRRNALDKAVRERTRELDRILEEIKKAKAAGENLKSRVKDQLVSLQTFIDVITESVEAGNIEEKFRKRNIPFPEFAGHTREPLAGKGVCGVSSGELADQLYEAGLNHYRENSLQAYEAGIVSAEKHPRVSRRI